jgi:hypothetical protein
VDASGHLGSPFDFAAGSASGFGDVAYTSRQSEETVDRILLRCPVESPPIQRGVPVSEQSASVRMRAAEEFMRLMGHSGIEQVTPFLSPNVVYQVPGQHALAGSFRGVDEVMAHMLDLVDRSGGTFNVFKFEDWLVSENSVAAVVDLHIQGHGATVTERNVFLFGFDGSDRISEISIFFQNEGAIERFFGV